MEMRKCLACLMFFMVYPWAGRAQSDARIELSRASVTAGDHLGVSVKLPIAVTCDTAILIYFQDQKVSDQFQIRGSVTTGQAEVKLQGDVPRDLKAGEYKAVQGSVQPCPGYSK